MARTITNTFALLLATIASTLGCGADVAGNPGVPAFSLFVGAQDNPRNLLVDEAYVYWSRYAPDIYDELRMEVVRSRLDGNQVEVLADFEWGELHLVADREHLFAALSGSIGLPPGECLVLDPRFCPAIVSMKKDGTDINRQLTTLDTLHPRDIALDADFVYWMQNPALANPSRCWSATELRRMPKLGGTEELVADGEVYAETLAVVGDTLYMTSVGAIELDPNTCDPIDLASERDHRGVRAVRSQGGPASLVFGGQDAGPKRVIADGANVLILDPYHQQKLFSYDPTSSRTELLADLAVPDGIDFLEAIASDATHVYWVVSHSTSPDDETVPGESPFTNSQVMRVSRETGIVEQFALLEDSPATNIVVTTDYVFVATIGNVWRSPKGAL